jgi:hypothetical protein
MIFFSPSRYFTARTGPSTLQTVWPTPLLVIVPLAAPGHPADAAHALGEDAKLACLLGTVGLRNPAGSNIVARLDVGGRRLHPGDD